MVDVRTTHYLSSLLTTLAPDCSVSSAGVGRTGAYIVLDWSLQAIHEKDELNIFQIVCTLREHRVLMVQTEVSEKRWLPVPDNPVVVPVLLDRSLHSSPGRELNIFGFIALLSPYHHHVIAMSSPIPCHNHFI